MFFITAQIQQYQPFRSGAYLQEQVAAAAGFLLDFSSIITSHRKSLIVNITAIQKPFFFCIHTIPFCFENSWIIDFIKGIHYYIRIE